MFSIISSAGHSGTIPMEMAANAQLDYGRVAATEQLICLS